MCACVYTHTRPRAAARHSAMMRVREKERAKHTIVLQLNVLLCHQQLSSPCLAFLGVKDGHCKCFAFRLDTKRGGEKQRGWEGEEGEGEGVGTSVCVCRVCVCAVASTAKAKSIDPTPPRPRLLPPPPPSLHLPCDCLLSKRTTALLPKQPMPTVVFFLCAATQTQRTKPKKFG